MSWVKNEEFFNGLLKGNLMKEIVSVMLQESGYQAIPYGYEITLTGLSEKLRYIPKKRSKTVRRIRASPDLLVYRPKKSVGNGLCEVDDLMLVEVKMRRIRAGNTVRINRELITDYKDFWKDSILVIVVPKNEIFYAQYMSELDDTKDAHSIREFKKIQYIFKRLAENNGILKKYQAKVKLILDAILIDTGA